MDNVLIGGKAIAATHITNAATRIHYGEWQVGAAAGVTAGWLVSADTLPSRPARGDSPGLHAYPASVYGATGLKANLVALGIALLVSDPQGYRGVILPVVVQPTRRPW